MGVDSRYEYISFGFRKRHPPPPDVGDRVCSTKKLYIDIYLPYNIIQGAKRVM